jgi:hypothetical protein
MTPEEREADRIWQHGFEAGAETVEKRLAAARHCNCPCHKKEYPCESCCYGPAKDTALTELLETAKVFWLNALLDPRKPSGRLRARYHEWLAAVDAATKTP